MPHDNALQNFIYSIMVVKFLWVAIQSCCPLAKRFSFLQHSIVPRHPRSIVADSAKPDALPNDPEMKLLTFSTPTPRTKHPGIEMHAHRMTDLFKEWTCHA